MHNLIEIKTEQDVENLPDLPDLLKESLLFLAKEPLEKLTFVKTQSYITQFAVLAVSTSARQIDAISTGVIQDLKKKKLFNTTIKLDGNGERGWCIIDLSCCLINILVPEKLQKYKLEDIFKGKFTDITD